MRRSRDRRGGGGCSNTPPPPPPAGGGKSRGPSGHMSCRLPAWRHPVCQQRLRCITEYITDGMCRAVGQCTSGPPASVPSCFILPCHVLFHPFPTAPCAFLSYLELFSLRLVLAMSWQSGGLSRLPSGSFLMRWHTRLLYYKVCSVVKLGPPALRHTGKSFTTQGNPLRPSEWVL